MDQRIKDIIPPTKLSSDFDELNTGVTYILRVEEENYHFVYEFQDYINDLPETTLITNYSNKLREGQNDSIYIDSCIYNMTGTPRGLVFNFSDADAITFEKILIIRLLKTESVWTVEKIDNTQIQKDIEKINAEIFESLFEIA